MWVVRNRTMVHPKNKENSINDVFLFSKVSPNKMLSKLFCTWGMQLFSSFIPLLEYSVQITFYGGLDLYIISYDSTNFYQDGTIVHRTNVAWWKKLKLQLSLNIYWVGVIYKYQFRPLIHSLLVHFGKVFFFFLQNGGNKDNYWC